MFLIYTSYVLCSCLMKWQYFRRKECKKSTALFGSRAIGGFNELNQEVWHHLNGQQNFFPQTLFDLGNPTFGGIMLLILFDQSCLFWYFQGWLCKNNYIASKTIALIQKFLKYIWPPPWKKIRISRAKLQRE